MTTIDNNLLVGLFSLSRFCISLFRAFNILVSRNIFIAMFMLVYFTLMSTIISRRKRFARASIEK